MQNEFIYRILHSYNFLDFQDQMHKQDELTQKMNFDTSLWIDFKFELARLIELEKTIDKLSKINVNLPQNKP